MAVPADTLVPCCAAFPDFVTFEPVRRINVRTVFAAVLGDFAKDFLNLFFAPGLHTHPHTHTHTNKHTDTYEK